MYKRRIATKIILKGFKDNCCLEQGILQILEYVRAKLLLQ